MKLVDRIKNYAWRMDELKNLGNKSKGQLKYLVSVLEKNKDYVLESSLAKKTDPNSKIGLKRTGYCVGSAYHLLFEAKQVLTKEKRPYIFGKPAYGAISSPTIGQLKALGIL